MAVTAIITPEQITAAQQAADQADRELTQLQRQAFPWTETDSSLALGIEVALAHRDTAHRDAERLANRYQRQQEALQARQIAEEAATAVLETINSDLAGLRDRASRDIATAQEALLAAVRAVQTYNRRVRDATEQLGGVGLTALPEGIETNSQPLSYRAGVKLTGQYWLAVDPAAVPRVVARRVTRATIGHKVERLTYGFESLAEQLLHRSRLLPPDDLPDLTPPQVAPPRGEPGGGAAVTGRRRRSA